VRVLIVDDDPDARELFTYMLTTHGATVHAVESAGAALEVFNLESFDVLTIDGGMPNQSGWSLLETIRRMAPEQGGLIPAAAITAFAYPEDEARSLASGFQVHLSKPVPLDDLVATIARLVGRGDGREAGA
jgi:CheY-like chemotaxis protein